MFYVCTLCLFLTLILARLRKYFSSLLIGDQWLAVLDRQQQDVVFLVLCVGDHHDAVRPVKLAGMFLSAADRFGFFWQVASVGHDGPDVC